MEYFDLFGFHDESDFVCVVFGCVMLRCDDMKVFSFEDWSVRINVVGRRRAKRRVKKLMFLFDTEKTNTYLSYQSNVQNFQSP